MSSGRQFAPDQSGRSDETRASHHHPRWVKDCQGARAWCRSGPGVCVYMPDRGRNGRGMAHICLVWRCAVVTGSGLRGVHHPDTAGGCDERSGSCAPMAKQVSARRIALDGVIMILTIAMRLSPLERDLLEVSLFALQQRFWPCDVPDTEDPASP